MRSLFIFLLVLTSCRSTTESVDYIEIPFKSEIHEDDAIFTAKLTGIDFPVSFIQIKDVEPIYIEINDVSSILPEFEPPLSGFTSNSAYFRLFKRAEEYVLMYPVFSEEFPTFQLLGFNSKGKLNDLGCHTYSFDAVEKFNLYFGEDTYVLGELNDTLRIYREGSTKILLSKLRFRNSQFEPMSTADNEKMQALRSPEKAKKTNSFDKWIGTYHLQFDVLHYPDFNNMDYRFTVLSEETIRVELKIDGKPSDKFLLYVKSRTTDQLVLLSESDEKTEYILTLREDKYYLSGTSIYMDSPPNEEWEITFVPDSGSKKMGE